jgi:hypothetical protein
MAWGLDSFATIGMDDEMSPERGGIMRKAFKFLLVGAAAVTLAGCASRRPASQAPPFAPPPPPRPVAVYPSPAPVIVPQGGVPAGSYPPGYAPPGGFPQGSFQPGSVPPGNFPTAPGFNGPSPTLPGSPGAPGGAPFPTAPPPPNNPFPVAPPPGSPGASNAPNAAPDRVGYRWQPDVPQSPAIPAVPPPPVPPLAHPAPPASSRPPSVLLLPPVPDTDAPAAPKQEQRQLYPPDQKEPPIAALPVGIAAFDRPRDGVWSGQRPSLEGLDWLQKSNYKTVVYLHLPGAAIDSDRQQVEKRGMTFVPIEIDPRELKRGSVEQFLRLQTENRGDKVFVYDLDGSLAGAMWFLAYRLVDQDSDETARIKAGSLGQRENSEAAREIWRAARKYIEQK